MCNLSCTRMITDMIIAYIDKDKNMLHILYRDILDSRTYPIMVDDFIMLVWK